MYGPFRTSATFLFSFFLQIFSVASQRVRSTTVVSVRQGVKYRMLDINRFCKQKDGMLMLGIYKCFGAFIAVAVCGKELAQIRRSFL